MYMRYFPIRGFTAFYRLYHFSEPIGIAIYQPYRFRGRAGWSYPCESAPENPTYTDKSDAKVKPVLATHRAAHFRYCAYTSDISFRVTSLDIVVKLPHRAE